MKLHLTTFRCYDNFTLKCHYSVTLLFITSEWPLNTADRSERKGGLIISKNFFVCGS